MNHDEALTPPPIDRGRRRTVAIAVSVAAICAAAAVVAAAAYLPGPARPEVRYTVPPTGHPQQSTPAAPAPASVDAWASRSPAGMLSAPTPTVDRRVRRELRSFADRVAARGQDAPGRYAYLQVRQDSHDPDILPGHTGPLGRHVVRTHRWRGPGGEGRQVSFELTAGCRQINADTRWNRDMPGWVDEPLADDPAMLRRQLPGRAGTPTDVIADLAALLENHYASTPVRATVLRLLAETPGLLLAPTTSGGRTTVAVSAMDVDLPQPDRTVRYTLTFDARTGQPVAYQTAFLDPGSVPAYERATTELTHTWQQVTRTTSTTTPAVGC
ncbi:hypothetical protein [Phytohabitans rumicis]|uniref:hypothetical protein n=1 Tax=Phytohabitans rumicis TaxID=1076125 RepID=UPI001565F64E|nr:hypothetical protein [Phytohabitans rumicis]